MLGCEVVTPGSGLRMKVCCAFSFLIVGCVSNMTCYLCVSYKGEAATFFGLVLHLCGVGKMSAGWM